MFKGFDRRRFIAGLFGGAATATAAVPSAPPLLSPEAQMCQSIIGLKVSQGEKLTLLRLNEYGGFLLFVANNGNIYVGDYQFGRQKADALEAELRRLYPTTNIVVSRHEDVQDCHPKVTINGDPFNHEFYFDFSVEDDKVKLLTRNMSGTTYSEVMYDGHRTVIKELDFKPHRPS